MMRTVKILAPFILMWFAIEEHVYGSVKNKDKSVLSLHSTSHHFSTFLLQVSQEHFPDLELQEPLQQSDGSAH